MKLILPLTTNLLQLSIVKVNSMSTPREVPISGINQILIQHRDSLNQTVSDHIAEEVPIALVYNGISHAVMMATPKDLESFAIGFSLAEGIIHKANEIYDIEIRPACNGLEVNIEITTRRFVELKEKRRAMAGRTGCGLCGVEQLTEVVKPIAALPITQSFNLSYLDHALKQLTQVQPIGQLTGCTHAAAWLNPQGEVLGGCEDVGRHVALDKLLGMKAKQPEWKNGAVLVSSRASYEMVQKAAMCGVEILFAVSAATSLAVEVAEKCHLTLVGFCKQGRATVYTHPDRLTESGI